MIPAEFGATGCPDCERDIDMLGGNPDCETCAAEPADEQHEQMRLDTGVGLRTVDGWSRWAAVVKAPTVDESDPRFYQDHDWLEWFAVAYPDWTVDDMVDSSTPGESWVVWISRRTDEPELEVEPVAGVGELVAEYAYCDQCGHSGRLHVNAHDLPEPARAFAFAHATCWAETICETCDGFAFADAGSLAAEVTA